MTPPNKKHYADTRDVTSRAFSLRVSREVYAKIEDEQQRTNETKTAIMRRVLTAAFAP